jgi:hypothetical protein
MMNVEQMHDGQWYAAKDYPYEACCDCCLVHRLKARIRKGRIELCATRDNRRTAALRRQMKHGQEKET